MMRAMASADMRATRVINFSIKMVSLFPMDQATGLISAIVQTGEDDETTKFSARASLYSFKDKAWKEAGKGTFKFNTKTSSTEDDPDSPPTSGRFIMRAHQTYRVLLNAPVLKKMTVGDGQGKEPSGKSFSFGVVEQGMLVPYLLKVREASCIIICRKKIANIQ